jgi:hypothetical protein
MADATPAATDLPPVKVEDFLADREGFAEGVWRATTFAVAGIASLLILLAIFLL